MAPPSASDRYYGSAPPPSRPAARPTREPEMIDLTDIGSGSSDEWDFEGVSSDSSPEPIQISSDSDSSVEAIVVTQDVRGRIKQFRKTRPKHDSCPDDEDLPAKAERFARTVFRKAESFIDNEAGHSGADNSGDIDDTGYVSNLINDSPSSSEPDAPSPVAHVAPTRKQRGEHARNAAENAINVIIPTLQPQKQPSVVKLTWCDPRSNKIRSKKYRCYDNISDESDGQASWAYVPDEPADEPQVSLSPRELKRKRTQSALAAHKKARAARKQR